MNRRFLLLVLIWMATDLYGQFVLRGPEIRSVPQELTAKFEKVQLYSLDYKGLYDFVRQHKGPYRIKVLLGAYQWDIELDEYPIVAPGAKVRVMTEEGIKEYPKPNIHYRGHVIGTDHTVYFAISPSLMLAEIKLDEGAVFIERARRLAPSLDDNAYIVYHTADVKPVPGLRCGFEMKEEEKQRRIHPKRRVEARRNCYELIVAMAADWDYNQAHGGVNGAISQMSSVLGLVATDFDDPFNDEIQILDGPTFVSDCPSCDPWPSTTDANALLASFRNWGNNGGFGTSDYGVASLWVERNISGSVVGIAYLNGLCNSNRYNVLEDFTSSGNLLRNLQSHEMGHNFGCNHVSGFYIMAASITGSDQWHSSSKSIINSRTPAPCMYPCANGSPPVANFTSNKEVVCLNIDPTVEFYDQSDNANTYFWEFEGGTPSTSTAQNPVVTYSQRGRYRVTLTVTNAFGDDVLVREDYIWVRDVPIADFDYDFDQYEPNKVHFYDFSTDVDTWEWDFDDGNYSYQQNPVHVYERDGLYYATLRVVNVCGEDATSQYIDVVTPVSAKFYTDTVRHCDSLCTTFFVYNEDNIDEWKWSFPGGKPSTSTKRNPRVCYSKPGKYDVFLEVRNIRYIDTLTLRNYIRVDSHTVARIRDTMHRVDSLIHYLWDISKYHDSLTLDFDDTTWIVDDSVTIRRLNSKDTLRLALDTSARITLPESWAGDTIQVEYLKDSVYPLTVITHGVCGNDTLHTWIVAGKKPTAGIEQLTVVPCVGQVLQLVDASTPNATRWSWTVRTDTGVIAQSDQRHFDWVPAQKGTYEIVHIASNGVGSDTVSLSVDVLWDVPQADFAYNIVGGETVQFESKATSAQWHQWIFGDGNTSDEANPSHTYAQAGSYTVTYIVGNDCYGADTVVKVIDLTALHADFSASTTEGCAPLTVQFTNRSSKAVRYEWILVGAQPPTSNQPNPTAVYSNGGTFEVKLIAFDAQGHSDTAAGVFITVDEAPQAAFDYNAQGLEVAFVNRSTGTRLSYEWDFGDGNTTTQENPIHRYAQSGIYEVQLIASNPLCPADTHTTTLNLIGTGSTIILGDGVEMSIRPNPARDRFQVAVKTSKPAHIQMRIYRVDGKVKYDQAIDLTAGTTRWIVSSSDWPRGLYIVHIRHAEQHFTLPLVIVE